jgi:hypothetical protein
MHLIDQPVSLDCEHISVLTVDEIEAVSGAGPNDFPVLPR